MQCLDIESTLMRRCVGIKICEHSQNINHKLYSVSFSQGNLEQNGLRTIKCVLTLRKNKPFDMSGPVNIRATWYGSPSVAQQSHKLSKTSDKVYTSEPYCMDARTDTCLDMWQIHPGWKSQGSDHTDTCSRAFLYAARMKRYIIRLFEFLCLSIRSSINSLFPTKVSVYSWFCPNFAYLFLLRDMK